MTSSAETLVAKEFDFETGLRELIARGYQFVHPRDGNGEVLEIVGIRMHGSVVDVVRLGAEDNVVAMRMPGDEKNILAPARVLWRSFGSVGTVLAEALALPEDRVPGSLARMS
jgi:hypothetical protein